MWNTNISLKTSYKGAPPISVKSYCLRLSWLLVSALTFACILVLNFQNDVLAKHGIKLMPVLFQITSLKLLTLRIFTKSISYVCSTTKHNLIS